MNAADAYHAMQALLATPAGSHEQKQQLLVLTEQPVTSELLVGAAQALQAVMLPFPRPNIILGDVVGTGGDGLNTYNISTATSLVLAAAGVPIAKHGNRASSSASGAADVLQKLGVDIHMPAEKMAACLQHTNWAFLLAPMYHPQLGNLAATRKALGRRSFINLLGPLVNPAKPDWLLLGVAKPEYLEPMAEAMQHLGMQRAWVVCGAGHMDELSLSGVNQICILADGTIDQAIITPEETGLTRHPITAVQAPADADYAAALIAVLQGQPSAYTDAVCLNTAAGLVLAGTAKNIRIGVQQAHAILQSGTAYTLLQKIKENVGQA